MAQAISTILATTAEKISPLIPELLEKADTTAYGLLVKGAQSHRITKTTNNMDFRIPFVDEMPGTFAAMNLAGGAFASGKGFNTQQMYQTYFPVQMGFSLNLDTIYATQDKSLAAKNAFKETMKRAPNAFRYYQDVSCHNIESGYQGLVAEVETASAGSGVYTLVLDNTFGANLLTKGMKVEVFSSNLSVHRTSGIAVDDLPYISVCDKGARTVTLHLNGQSVTVSDGDFLALPGVGATPSWINGLYYFQTTSTSGNLLGVAKASNPELLPSLVNANGGLVPQHGLLLHSKIRQRRGMVSSKLQGFMPMAQAAAVYNLGVAISEWQRGKSDEMIDVLPKISDYVTWCGVRYFVDIRQDKTRLEVIDKSNWGRVYLEGGEPDFYRTPGDGRMFFEGRNSNGARVATTEFSMVSTENIYSADPGSGGVIYGCSVPTDF